MYEYLNSVRSFETPCVLDKVTHTYSIIIIIIIIIIHLWH
jgi:hypothetical protein